jgi:glutaredoxin
MRRAGPGVRTVTVYGRPGCHLCEEAMVVVQRVHAQHDFSLEIVDIESDDALMLAYLERIPVVAVDGRELWQFRVDEGELIATIANLGPPARGPAH